MLSGFNNNFRYRGVLFHVQTEDSGVSNPHVITHLFHGGNILASEKLDYSERLELPAAELEEAVRELMESQHKSMLKRLQRGLHDTVIRERLGPEVFSESPAPETSDTDTSFAGSEPEPAAEPPPTLPPTAEIPIAAPTVVESSPPVAAAAAESRGFGEGVVTQKPLDEVVLEYLVENARKRKRRNR